MKVIIRQDGFPSGEPNFLVRLAKDERIERAVRISLLILIATVFILVVFPLMVESPGWDKIMDWGGRMIH